MNDFEKLKQVFESTNIEFILNGTNGILVGNQLFRYDDNGIFIKNYIINDINNPLTYRSISKCTKEEKQARDEILETIKKLGMEHNIYINRFECNWSDYFNYTLQGTVIFANHDPDIHRVGERIKCKDI